MDPIYQKVSIPKQKYTFHSVASTSHQTLFLSSHYLFSFVASSLILNAAPIDDSTPDPSEARTSVTISASQDKESSEDSDDIPLMQRKQQLETKEALASDSDDDIPLAERRAATMQSMKQESSDDDDDIPLVSAGTSREK